MKLPGEIPWGCKSPRIPHFLVALWLAIWLHSSVPDKQKETCSRSLKDRPQFPKLFHAGSSPVENATFGPSFGVPDTSAKGVPKRSSTLLRASICRVRIAAIAPIL